MKRNLLGIIIAAVAFAGSYFFTLYVSALRPLTLCEVVANENYYKSREVRVRVWLQRNKSDFMLEDAPAGFVIATSACDSEQQAGGAAVNFSKIADVERLKATFMTNERKGFQPIHLTQAVMTGTLDFDENTTHCFTPKYRLENAQLEKIELVVTLEDETQLQTWIENNLC